VSLRVRKPVFTSSSSGVLMSMPSFASAQRLTEHSAASRIVRDTPMIEFDTYRGDVIKVSACRVSRRGTPGVRGLLAITFALCFCAGAAHADVSRLVRAYPDHVDRVDGNDLVMRTGARLPISDGRTGKTMQELLTSPDIDDMFTFAYPRAFPTVPPQADPGRFRNHAFFAAMYGDCAKDGLKGKLVPVRWLPKHGGGTVLVTSVNGVDRKLAAVSAELDELPANLMAFLKPAGGTYNCRVVADTKQPSAHGYGIAIDINIEKGDYWLWSGGNWRNRIPEKIVLIFERHGFIWGGKWKSFDTMHFEYRPELLD
jgi:D-alanyl-D-alanine carboxypeptidase